MAISLSVTSVSKSFSGKAVLHAVSFEAEAHDVIGIAGRNGSGKSTLVKIVCGLLSPGSGSVTLTINEKKIDPDNYYRHIGFVAPYLALYDEFSPKELLRITAKLRDIPWNEHDTKAMIDRCGLSGHLEETVHGFSSGMMQRMRLATALQHDPELLALDEPTTNLDEHGVAIVRDIVERHKQQGIVLLATNNAAELEWCTKVITVERITE